MYALVDCNNFYVSCERLFAPHLEGRPVVVLSNNDGCAVSRSDEAKALGIKMAAPIFMHRDLVKRYNIVCLSSNYAFYGEISRRVMSLFEQWTPDIEVYSIDEAFLYFHGQAIKRLPTMALEIRKTVFQWTGIPVSVGIGSTKTLAKAASSLAKQSKSGVFVLDDPVSLKELPVAKVWGIGPKYATWLTDHRINTAWDLREANELWIRDRMTVVGHRTVMELRGIPCIDLEQSAPDKKNMAHARLFGKLLEDKDEIREAVTHYAESIAAKLRIENLAASNISVFLETNPFRTQDSQFQVSAHARFSVPTNFSPEIISKAVMIFEKIFRPKYRYKKAGILLQELVPESQVQGELFDRVDWYRTGKLMLALDGVNLRHGRDTLGFAGAHLRRGWAAKYEKRTERFTTRWDELPKVVA